MGLRKSVALYVRRFSYFTRDFLECSALIPWERIGIGVVFDSFAQQREDLHSVKKSAGLGEAEHGPAEGFCPTVTRSQGNPDRATNMTQHESRVR